MKILDAWSIRFEIVLVFLSDGGMQSYSENCQKIENLLTESEQYSSTIQENGCAADFSLLNLPKGKSLGRSKPATNS